jgi:hypothetical protein
VIHEQYCTKVRSFSSSGKLGLNRCGVAGLGVTSNTMVMLMTPDGW